MIRRKSRRCSPFCCGSIKPESGSRRGVSLVVDAGIQEERLSVSPHRCPRPRPGTGAVLCHTAAAATDCMPATKVCSVLQQYTRMITSALSRRVHGYQSPLDMISGDSSHSPRCFRNASRNRRTSCKGRRAANHPFALVEVPDPALGLRHCLTDESSLFITSLRTTHSSVSAGILSF